MAEQPDSADNVLSDSPYRAPRTVHLDQEPEPYKPRMFSLHGRIGRARFIAYSWWSTFLLTVFSVVFIGAVSRFLGLLQEPVLFPFAYLLGFLLYAPVLIMVKRRLNDLNISGWVALTVFLPFLNLLLMLALVAWPGNRGGNQYGPPPTGNTLLMVVFGVLLPAFMLIGFLSALLMPLLSGMESFGLQQELMKGVGMVGI